MENLFNRLFGLEPEEPPIEEQMKRFLYAIEVAARLSKILPLEDIFGADIGFLAQPGTVKIELRGKDLVDEIETDVDVDFELNRKAYFVDNEGELVLMVFGFSKFGVYPEVFSYWFTHMPKIYERGNPSIKPPIAAYSVGLN